ncbi:MAG: SPOR domain-containing protein [Siphonobacter sp.]
MATPTKSSTKAYDLDLSSYRPTYAVSERKQVLEDTKVSAKPAVTPPASNQPLSINRRLDYVLDTLANRNKAVRYVAGYRIQLYTGTKRNEMDAAKIFIYQTYPELNTYIAYNHPTYRLRVGDFATRLDVERYFNKLKDQYPTATITSDRVTLRDALKIMDQRGQAEDQP